MHFDLLQMLKAIPKLRTQDIGDNYANMRLIYNNYPVLPLCVNVRKRKQKKQRRIFWRIAMDYMWVDTLLPWIMREESNLCVISSDVATLAPAQRPYYPLKYHSPDTMDFEFCKLFETFVIFFFYFVDYLDLSCIFMYLLWFNVILV